MWYGNCSYNKLGVGVVKLFGIDNGVLKSSLVNNTDLKDTVGITYILHHSNLIYYEKL